MLKNSRNLKVEKHIYFPDTRDQEGLNSLVTFLQEVQLFDTQVLQQDKIALSRTLGLLQNRLGNNFLFRIKDLSTSNPSVAIAHPTRDTVGRIIDEGRSDYVHAIRDTLNLLLPLLPEHKFGKAITLRQAKVVAELEINLFKRSTWQLYLDKRDPLNITVKRI